MTTQIATTPEQSQRLIAYGVNPDSADMVWTTWDNDGERLTQLSTMSEFAYEVSCLNPIPAWSLSALLAMLPKEITDENTDEYHISLAYERPLCSDYDVSYKPCWFAGEDLIAKHDTCPIEACVLMIEWLTKNGYKLNKP